MSLVAKGNKHLASRVAAPVHREVREESSNRSKKLSHGEAAKALASLAEKNMERKGLLQEERNHRVSSFAAFVDSLKGSRRKS